MPRRPLCVLAATAALLVVPGVASARTCDGKGVRTPARSATIRAYSSVNSFGLNSLGACTLDGGTDLALADNNIFTATAVDVAGDLVGYNRELGTTSLDLVRVARLTPRFELVNSASAGHYNTMARLRITADGWMVYSTCTDHATETPPDATRELFVCRHVPHSGLGAVYLARPALRAGVKKRPVPGVLVARAVDLDPLSLRLTGRTFTWTQGGRRHTGHIPR